MFLSMQVQGQPPVGPVKEHLERRLRGAVERYGARASGIALRASASRPGGRVTCRVALSLDAGMFTGSARGANVFFAAEDAIARATRAADRVLREQQSALLGLLDLATSAGSARG